MITSAIGILLAASTVFSLRLLEDYYKLIIVVGLEGHVVGRRF